MKALKSIWGYIVLVVGGLLGLLFFFKNRPKLNNIDETDKKLLTNQLEIDRLNETKENLNLERSKLKESSELEKTKVLNENDPSKVIDFFNNRLNKP